MSDGYEMPKRELRFRDVWWPVFYFFWHNTWWVRRIWCKHNGVHFSDSNKGWWTMCANCYSKDVPQCCGSQPMILALNPSGVKRLIVTGRFGKNDDALPPR